MVMDKLSQNNEMVTHSAPRGAGGLPKPAHIKISITYRWHIRIVSRKENVKEEEAVMVGSALCSNNHCPQKIHS